MNTFSQSRTSLLSAIIITLMFLLCACSMPWSPAEPENIRERQGEEFFEPIHEEQPPVREELPPDFKEPPPGHEDPPSGFEEQPPGHELPPPSPEEPPPPEPEGQQPHPQEPDPRTDLEITDIYPGNLPNGNLFIRITNNGPVIMMAAPVELKCHANGRRWANQPGEDNRANSVQLVVQIGPGETTNEDTGIAIDANLFQYFVECSINSHLDSTPHNNIISETIPNP